MTPIFRHFLTFAVAASATFVVRAEEDQSAGYDVKQSSANTDAYAAVKALPQPSTKWFTDDKFGMFVHFGLYSIPGGVWKGEKMGRNDYAEWIRYQMYWPKPDGMGRAEYDTLLARFDPVKFDADAWIREVKNAGMKYFIITAKHHDGFALWDSKVSDYNVVKATPFKRDILKELRVACTKYGIKYGFYYSHWLDWDVGAPPPWPEIKPDPVLKQPTQAEYDVYWHKKCLPQVKELIDNYDPDIFWFDSWGGQRGKYLTPARLSELITLIRKSDPKCLINGRIGTDNGIDYLSMGDNEFPKHKISRPWETNATLNHSWGYSAIDFKWKPAAQILRSIVDNVSRGGNVQYNVGPTGDGEFQPAAIRRLREIGAWLAVNGEAVYGTSASALPEPKWGRLTEKNTASENRLNVFVYSPKGGAVIELDGPTEAPGRAYVLESREGVKVEKTAKGLAITLPKQVPDENITTLVLSWPAM